VDEGDVCVPACATDVSPQVTVTRGGFRQNRTTNRYVQTVTIRNRGTTTLTGPVALAVDQLSADAALFNKSGDTSCATPVSPYVTVNTGTDNLFSPGESARVTLEFTNPSNLGIVYVTRVLSGAPF
jgi:hypothetical protein